MFGLLVTAPNSGFGCGNFVFKKPLGYQRVKDVRENFPTLIFSEPLTT